MLRFVEANLVELHSRIFLKFRLENLPEDDGDVFRSRNHTLEKRNVMVQALVVDLVDDFGEDNVLELLEIHHHTGLGWNRTANGDLESIVMAVAVLVVANAVGLAILLVGHLGVVKTMRRGEFFSSSDFNHDGDRINQKESAASRAL